MVFDSDDDWVEGARLYFYPRLHEPLSTLGDRIGVNLYSVGHVGERQYVGVLDESEDTIEKALDDHGERNPVACLKDLSDGRTSEGSWVIRHAERPDLIEEGMQLHFTLFKREDGKPGREIYAHYEDDWRVAPLAHLREKNFDVERGVVLGTEYIDEHTHLILN